MEKMVVGDTEQGEREGDDERDGALPSYLPEICGQCRSERVGESDAVGSWCAMRWHV